MLVKNYLLKLIKHKQPKHNV